MQQQPLGVAPIHMALIVDISGWFGQVPFQLQMIDICLRRLSIYATWLALA
jgi:hypothetical protein